MLISPAYKIVLVDPFSDWTYSRDYREVYSHPFHGNRFKWAVYCRRVQTSIYVCVHVCSPRSAVGYTSVAWREMTKIGLCTVQPIDKALVELQQIATNPPGTILGRVFTVRARSDRVYTDATRFSYRFTWSEWTVFYSLIIHSLTECTRRVKTRLKWWQPPRNITPPTTYKIIY